MLWKVANFKIKDFSLSILSAILLSLPFLSSNLSLFVWVGFIPLFFALKDKNKAQAFMFAYFTGIVFWAITIYWLIHVTLFGQILLVLYLAVYFGIFGLLYSCTLYPARYVLFIPSLWVILEYARSHFLTGFPWALLGYSQYKNLVVIQIADVTGVWGVTFLIILVNVSIYRFIIGRKSLTAVKPALLPVLFITITLAYGINKIYSKPTVYNSKKIKISVIQGNIPQELKWDPSARDLIMQNYFELTSRAAKDNPDLIIWPEAALPVVLEEEPEYYMKLRQYLKTINKPLLFGSVTLKDNFYYNSALLLSGDARLLNQYDKLHLVPFGEYIPFRNTLRFLDTIAPIGDITRGKDYTIFKLPGFPIGFGVLICFEDVFPELARSFVSRGAGFLVNITNDAWFGKTPEAYQHLAASVFRAVENRVYLARCANTGVSVFISPLGKIVSGISDGKGNNIFIPGYCTDSLRLANDKPSFYNLYGDIFPLVCFLFFFYVIVFKNRKKK